MFHVVHFFVDCDWNQSAGWVLLEFSASVDDDPYGAFANWDMNDNDPCMWSGVHWVNGNIQKL